MAAAPGGTFVAVPPHPTPFMPSQHLVTHTRSTTTPPTRPAPEISPDLTRNDKSRMEPSGGPITKDNCGTEYYGTIFAFAESPLQRGLFWAGSDDGFVHVSRDGGESWQNVTPPELPEWALISIIEPSPHDAATAYVAANCYKQDDFQPYLYKTQDYGKTWPKITGGLPNNDLTRV